jgi:hypothetical protein
MSCGLSILFKDEFISGELPQGWCHDGDERMETGGKGEGQRER